MCVCGGGGGVRHILFSQAFQSPRDAGTHKVPQRMSILRCLVIVLPFISVTSALSADVKRYVIIIDSVVLAGCND